MKGDEFQTWITVLILTLIQIYKKTYNSGYAGSKEPKKLYDLVKYDVLH